MVPISLQMKVKVSNIINKTILVVLFCFVTVQPVIAFDLIGVLPFKNERLNAKGDWFGFYIQDRLLHSLRTNKNWSFHTSSTLRLWEDSKKPHPLITEKGTILISGSYQKVGNFVKVTTQIQKKRSAGNQEKKFETSFQYTDKEKMVHLLAQSVGKWIEEDFILDKEQPPPLENIKHLPFYYEYRKKLYAIKSIPEIKDILSLQDRITAESLPERVADLVEGMLILSAQLQGREKESLLTQSRVLLRKTLMNHPRDARLFALMAETLFLQKVSLEQIERTAEKAIQFNSQNDLAWLILALARGISSGAGKEALLQLNLINPYIWNENKLNGIAFQKGILDKEISKAYSIFLMIGKPEYLQ